MRYRRIALLAVSSLTGTCYAQVELPAHPPPANEVGNPPAAIFFDVTSLRDELAVSGLTTGSAAYAGETVPFEVLVRDGSCLHGSATNGPASSLSGWTSLGVVNATQGPVSGQVSLPVEVPRFAVPAGQTVGVALWFHANVGPRYFVDNNVVYQAFDDGAMRISTGEVWGEPFSFPIRFTNRHLVGSIFYEVNPCYPNCDASTAIPVLNVNDFLCFMSRSAAGDSYANCDQSTTPSVLNVSDFLCFTQQFAGGCS